MNVDDEQMRTALEASGGHIGKAVNRLKGYHANESPMDASAVVDEQKKVEQVKEQILRQEEAAREEAAREEEAREEAAREKAASEEKAARSKLFSLSL